ncbi:hypothetical protein DR088_00740 [Mycoplasma hyopneumoniae]|nr:hypothetical protein [Mesomycoplasma hyopneumoniae]MXR44697.1 hypothetical protein [Mesomycoplasma hyopneumoniae]MXR63618.1 hypothetical protein [Mesomycoplasma hyopneumoniae]
MKMKIWIFLKLFFFLPAFFLSSCFKIDFNLLNSGYKKKLNSTSKLGETFIFDSVMKGLSKNFKKPQTKYNGFLTKEVIQNLKIGQIKGETNEKPDEYFGLEEVIVKFFNTLENKDNFEKKEQLFLLLKQKIETTDFKLNLEIKDDKEYVSQKDAKIKIEDPIFNDQSDRDFYIEQKELFESDKDLNKFLEKKKKYLFLEEKFINEEKQWNPVIKLIFQLNMARFHLDFIQATQNMSKNIIVSIIDYIINFEKTKKQEEEKQAEINILLREKEQIELKIKEKTSEKSNKNDEITRKIEEISQKIINLNGILEQLKQKNLQILKNNVRKICDFLTNFFDPIYHYSMKSDYVFQNESDLRVNNQLAFSKFFSFFTKNLKEKLTKYGIESPFAILEEEKTKLIEKYFLPLI